MTLVALLEELKEVDHKTHDEYFKLVEGTRYDHWPVWLADPITKEYTTESETIFNGIVQASIQRACERREWYTGQFSMSHPGPYSADITDANNVDNQWFGVGDSPAEALLAAYIAAVREGEEAKR